MNDITTSDMPSVIYTGKITKLTNKRVTGWIDYQDADGRTQSVRFRGYIPAAEAGKRRYWMGGDKVSFTLEEDQYGLVAKTQSYLGNDNLDAFINSDIDNGDTMEGILVEFNGKPFFIDNDYGIVFAVKTQKIEMAPGKNIHATVVLKKKTALTVVLTDAITNPEVLRLEADAETNDHFRADVVAVSGNKCRIRLSEYDIEGKLFNTYKIPYEVGDWLYVRIFNLRHLVFLPA